MPRLFSALPLPEETTDQLALLRGALDGASWVEPDDFHITLIFFGDIDGRTADEIVSELDRIAAAPVPVRITGFGSFSRSGWPRTIHAEVEPTPELAALQTQHARILRRYGLVQDRHEFRPHVTLARLRGQVTPEACAKWLAARGPVRPEPFVAHEFVLFSSKDSVGGGPYVAEERFLLR